MKNLRLVMWTVLALAAVLYASVYFAVLPFAASLSAPYKWNRVLPGLPLTDYYRYLGKATGNQNQDKGFEQSWETRAGNYDYLLRISFGADSIATGVHMNYTFRNGLFHKSGTLMEKRLND